VKSGRNTYHRKNFVNKSDFSKIKQNKKNIIKRDIRLIYCFKVFCWRGVARGAF